MNIKLAYNIEIVIDIFGSVKAICHYTNLGDKNHLFNIYQSFNNKKIINPSTFGYFIRLETNQRDLSLVVFVLTNPIQSPYNLQVCIM